MAAAQKEVLKQADQDAEKEKSEKSTKKESSKKDAKKETKKEEKGKKGQSAKKTEAKKEVKKESKKEEEEIPMDQAAIKAYSSVIADAAEDSEPQAPVIYKKVIEDEKKEPHVDLGNIDPMGSMIQNEILSIKDASIKASKESTD